MDTFFSLLPTGLYALFETLFIAFIGTLFGALLSLPLATLAARNLFPEFITTPTRFVLALVRSIPALLWAVVFVILVGFGPIAGVLATIIYTTGYLAKLQYESIEGLPPGPLEAIISTGANKIQLIRFVVLKEAANQLISQLLFMFEYNVRSSSILGFVGAGGIGFYILGYLRLLEYDKVIILLLLILITVLIIDYVSVRIRDRYLVKTV